MTYPALSERSHCADYWGFTMRKILVAVLLNSAAVILLVAVWLDVALADPAADIDAVEQEIAAEDEAAAIYKRARERAVAAVAASSAGQDVANLQAALEAADAAFKKSEAYQQYLGDDKLGDLPEYPWRVECPDCSFDERTKKLKDAQDAHSAAVQAQLDEYEARRLHYDAAREAAGLDQMKDAIFAAQQRVLRLRKKMTDRFIEDEIIKAVEEDMKPLERELRKIRRNPDGVHDA